MRLVEHCACGASFEVVFSHPKQYPYTDEQEVALAQVEAWRGLHLPCRTRGLVDVEIEELARVRSEVAP